MFAVTILGNNSALPAFGRHPTSQLVQFEEFSILIDCGEGTQMQFQKYGVKKSKIDYIFISHLHGDHYLGLAGLLNSYSLLGRKEDIVLFAPEALEAILRLQFKVANTHLSYALHFHPIPDGQSLLVDNEDLRISAFETDHRIPCHGFVIEQKYDPRRINPIAVEAHNIPFDYYARLQQGENYMSMDGSIISNEILTLPGKSYKRYAYCADTRYDERFLENVKDVDLLYHETTYLKVSQEKAFERFHSTSIDAATIASKANAKKLIIGHFSSQYEHLDQFELEAKTVFPNTFLAEEGAVFEV